MAIDLHTHSIYSDGADTPEQLLEKAVSLGLHAIALTDHDTLNGVPEFMNVAASYSIHAIAGIEISASYKGRDIHILGYNINPEDHRLESRLSEIRKERGERNYKMLERLQSLGYDITYDEIADMAAGSDSKEKVISRLHFGKALYQHGYTKSINEAFDTILNPGCPGYIPRHRIDPEEALSLIRMSGGRAALAHPFLYKLTHEEVAILVDLLHSNGLEGLEVIHSTVSPEETQILKSIADRFHLHYTGGSDYHGINKPHVPLGVGAQNVQIPDSFLEFINK